MSITVTVARFQRKHRQEIIQAVQKQMQDGALQAVKKVLTACLEAEVTAKLGRERKESQDGSVASSEPVTGHVGIVDAKMLITSRVTGIITGIWKQALVTCTGCPFRWWSANAAITM